MRTIILERALRLRKATQPLDAPSRFEKFVITLLVMRSFLISLGTYPRMAIVEKIQLISVYFTIKGG